MSDYPSNPNFKETGEQIFVWEADSTVESSLESYRKMEKLLASLHWDEEEIYKINYAFHEILTNAIVHGNLGLKKTQSDKEKDFNGKVMAAEKLPQNRDKKVGIKVILSPTKAIIEIQDMGKNSPRFWENPTAGIRTGADISWKSGRGIQISEAFLNSVTYEKNNTGVKATLIRDLSVPLPEKSGAH